MNCKDLGGWTKLVNSVVARLNDNICGKWLEYCGLDSGSKNNDDSIRWIKICCKKMLDQILLVSDHFSKNGIELKILAFSGLRDISNRISCVREYSGKWLLDRTS